MVHLQKIHEQYKEKGVVVLGFNTADSREKVVELMKEKGATYPTVLDGSPRVQRIASDLYHSSSVPMNYIITRDGRIAAGFAGYGANDHRGDDAIEDLLAGRDPAKRPQPETVHGRIRAFGGKPLEGARLLLMKDGGRGSYAATTDASGEYMVRDVPPGAYRVLVMVIGKLGFSAPGGRVEVAKGKAVRHDVELPDTSIEGRIVDARSGEPFDYRDVRVSATPDYYSATPDETGRYRLVGLPPGSYRVSVDSPDPALVGQSREVELKDKLRDVGFRLARAPTGTLRLHVCDRAGKAARNLEFWLEVDGGVRTLFGRCVDMGVFEFELRAGNRVIGIRGQPRSIPVTIREGVTTQVEFTLQ